MTSRAMRHSALAVAVAIATFACAIPTPSKAADLAPAPAAQQSMAVVKMTNGLRFAPQTIIVRAGETVLWENASFSTHTVTSDSVPPGAAAFDSGDIGRRGQFSHTFTVPGEYHYYCAPHRRMGMVGVVVVEP